MPTQQTQTREQVAERAHLMAYGVDPDNRDEQEGWGLKTSATDALLALCDALYAHEGREAIRAMWDHHGSLNEVADELWELECSGADADVIACEFVPVVDEAMRGFLFAEAESIGVDVEEDRFDAYFLANALHEIRVLPESERAAAIRAVNDGASVADRARYAD